MSIFQLATVLIYVTSVLTSSDNQTSNVERSTPSTSLKLLLGSDQNTSENLTPLTDPRAVNKTASDTLPKPVTVDSVHTEGGLVKLTNIPKETKSSVTTDSENKDQSSPGLKLSLTNITDEQPIQEKSRTVGRKGVDNLEDIPIESSTEIKILSTIKASTELPVEIKHSSPVIENDKDKSRPTDTNLVKKPETNNTKHVPNVIVINPNNTTTHKPKPLWTTGEGDDDGKGMPSSPTQKEIGMPRKVDYIIPLVITIMATPVLGIAAYILYTRGRDCWDKRHYRRMDFLVDGMYD